ncbi:MAG: hypothetical protein GX434_15670 [Peptococcaceae bacterium]|nr:hypothetical protein [Peptococcaceae bacterium]
MSSESQNSVSNLIVTLTTLIFAITSMITVYISGSAWRDERESVRPYLTFYTSPEVRFSPLKQLVFSFTFQNAGLHPAGNLHIQTTIIDSELSGPPLHTDQYSLVNDISQNSTADLLIKLDNPGPIKKPVQMKPQYIIISLKYSDPVLGKGHEQIFYLKWAGIVDGNITPVFHASREDKNRILNSYPKINTKSKLQ